MKHYSDITLYVNETPTSSLDIYDEHNVFTIYEYGECVFQGDWLGTKKFVDTWRTKKEELAKMFNDNGFKTEFKGHWSKD